MDVRGEVAVVAEDGQVAAKPRRRKYAAGYKRPSTSGGSSRRPTRARRGAYAAHPARFQRGAPVPPTLPKAAWINKPSAAPALAVPEGTGS